MNFLKTLGIVSGNSTGGLPYSIDSNEKGNSSSSSDANFDQHCLSDFYLFNGKSKQDSSRHVSIFKSKQPANAITQNALKRYKTLRHPNVLSFLDGIEMPNHGSIIIVTEQVVPLPEYLSTLHRQYAKSGGINSPEFQMSIAWGLRSILLALKFINCDCKLFHGRLDPKSIFVTKGGDWKLGGFELTGELTDAGPSYIYTANEQYTDAMYKSPECQRREWKTMGNAFPFASDIWSFACVLYTIFHENSFLSSNLLSNASNLPSALQTHFRQALDQDPFKRPSPEKFLTSNFFNTLFIQRMDFLENLAIKNSEEKIEYFKELYANLDSLPCCFGRHKILPALKNVVDFTSTNTSIKLDSSASFMLPIIVQIGSLQLNDEEFKIQVVPLLVKFFTCPDRAVRVQLLQKMEKFVVHFDTKLINSEMIFDNICTGFTDASPVLRELTVKSILHFADKLSESNLNTKIMKFFAKLLQDPEPAIRTNTTICLGRLASQLNVKTRSKILFPAFSKAMKDSFPHARLAGLRSMTACEEFFEPMICASNILPCISPLLLDTSMLVREQASVSIQIFMKKINEEAKQMKIKEEEQAKEDKMKQQELQQQASAALSPSGASGALSASRMESVTGYASSLTSWASSKLVGSGPITPVSSSTTPSASTGTHASTTTINTTTSSNSTDSMNSLASIGGSNAADVFAMGGGDVADAWGEDDDLDLVNSPQPSGAKKTTTTRSRTNDASEWGDDLDLDFEDSSTVPTPSKVTSSSSSVTPTFGSYNSISNSSISLGGQNNHRTATETATATTVGPSSDSTTIHTTSTTTNRLGAMKLETTKKITEANEWDNWDF